MVLYKMNFEKMISKADTQWYKELFTNSEKKSLSEEKINEIVVKSMESAENVFIRYRFKLEQLGIVETINNFGVKVSFNTINKSNTVIAMFDNKAKELIIFESSISELLIRMNNWQQNFIDEEKLKKIILAHELYHIIEMHDKNIYTFSKINKKNFWGISLNSRIVAASEIGAFHFSKLVNNLTFSPCLIGKIF